MHNLMQELKERISEGLRRKSITSCSRWAEAYRVMGPPYPGSWAFAHHPWLRDMHDDQSELVIGQKSAQMGFTECALNKAFFALDVKHHSVLYLLPASKPDAHDFTKSRFDPALELAPHLAKMFSDVSNIGHKRTGTANLFIRGTKSRSQVKSLPVALIIADEVDEMNQANLVLAFERTAGQVEKQAFLLSTPSIADVGINTFFKRSSQSHFFFRCPSCSRKITLSFPESIVITSEDPLDPKIEDTHIICSQCRSILNHETKAEWLKTGEWVPSYSDRPSSGYYINQLFSSTVKPSALAIQFLNGRTNPFDEQEFYNSKLGMPHEIENARVTDSVFNACVKGYTMTDTSHGAFVTVGVDVGKDLHYVVMSWFFDYSQSPSGSIDLSLVTTGRLLKAGTAKSFDELDLIMLDFGAAYAVIDHQPETRLSLEFCNRFYGRAKTCLYPRGISQKQIQQRPDEPVVSVDRTSWLDVVLARFRSRTIELPQNVPQAFRQHIQALCRIYKKDPDGNPVGKYEKPEYVNDHYAHSLVYAEVALHLGASLMQITNITTSVL